MQISPEIAAISLPSGALRDILSRVDVSVPGSRTVYLRTVQVTIGAGRISLYCSDGKRSVLGEVDAATSGPTLCVSVDAQELAARLRRRARVVVVEIGSYCGDSPRHLVLDDGAERSYFQAMAQFPPDTEGRGKPQ